MTRAAFLLPILLCTAVTASAQAPLTPAYPQPQAMPAADVGYSLNDWRRLRQGGNFAFADYARFLIANPGWPGDTDLRRRAEGAMRGGESPATVLALFQTIKPLTGNGRARYAEALLAGGRSAEAMAMARSAWASDDLGALEEQQLFARFGGSFTRDDHDRRVDSLLFDKQATNAQRFIALVSPARRATFEARIAMLRQAPDAEALFQRVAGHAASDAGLLMDRLRYYRAAGSERGARSLAARPHNFTQRPANPDRFYEMLLLLAEGAQSDGQYSTAYNIARQLDDSFAPGTSISDQAYGVRDKYTSLAWLAGTLALDRLQRPGDAVAMFDRYSRGGKSLQVATKGQYWAGRAALAAGRLADGSAYFQRAAQYPDLFYGQLALERVGRSVPKPNPLLSFAVTPTLRAEFANRRLVRATRLLGQQGRLSEQALFVRALAESLDHDGERIAAIEFGRQIGRLDLPVWVARDARNKGYAFYVEPTFPTVSHARSPRLWSITHGIARQESSFDRVAMSPVGARGVMQLMVPTAREQAGKLGVGFESSRLTDPSYNMMLGSAYFQWLLDYWDGSIPLAVASYNGGMGNVRKWVNRYGDPRGRTDVIRWIESIPFSETKGYVQRVIENSVVYDSLRPSAQQQSAVHVSRYLGKSRPG